MANKETKNRSLREFLTKKADQITEKQLQQAMVIPLILEKLVKLLMDGETRERLEDNRRSSVNEKTR